MNAITWRNVPNSSKGDIQLRGYVLGEERFLITYAAFLSDFSLYNSTGPKYDETPSFSFVYYRTWARFETLKAAQQEAEERVEPLIRLACLTGEKP